MPPLAPVITQTVPTTGAPTPIDTEVATLAQPGDETDAGPFTYAITKDLTSSFALGADGASLVAAVELDGAFFVAVTATSADGTSPEGGTTLTFADDLNEWNNIDDPYAGNAQLPPPTPDNEKWKFFLRQAALTIVPRARFGVDFMVAREVGKTSGQAIVAWDDTLLGPCPTQEIEDYAKQLSAAWPWETSAPPVKAA